MHQLGPGAHDHELILYPKYIPGPLSCRNLLHRKTFPLGFLWRDKLKQSQSLHWHCLWSLILDICSFCPIFYYVRKKHPFEHLGPEFMKRILSIHSKGCSFFARVLACQSALGRTHVCWVLSFAFREVLR